MKQSLKIMIQNTSLSDNCCINFVRKLLKKMQLNIVLNHRNIGEYAKLRLSKQIADFLTKVEFNNKKNNALTIEFGQIGNENRIKQKLEEGLKLLPYKPGMCQLQSYPLKGNSSVTCIDIFIARDLFKIRNKS